MRLLDCRLFFLVVFELLGSFVFSAFCYQLQLALGMHLALLCGCGIHVFRAMLSFLVFENILLCSVLVVGCV